MMTLSPRRHGIERFGDRIDWAILNLEPDPRITETIRTKAILKRKMIELLGRADAGSDTSWKRWSRGETAIPDQIIQGLSMIYPEFPREALVAPSYREFEQLAIPVLQSRLRWIEAINYVRLRRDELALIGKLYHASVDQERSFPLIARTGWLLDKPLELAEKSINSHLDLYAREDEPGKLEGLNVDYTYLKSRLMRPKDRPWNADCFRMVDIASMDALSFTFGPSSYYRCMNSVGALETELADFALRYPNQRPDALSLRGLPEQAFNFKARSTLPGVTCLLVLKGHFFGTNTQLRSNKFVVQERSENVFENQNTIACVPGGGHAPIAEHFGDPADVSIWRTIVREFLEEFFDRQTFERFLVGGKRFSDLISESEAQEYFRAFFGSDGAARVYLLGVGLDPVNLKPDILATVIVDWPKASRKISQLSARRDNFEGRSIFIDFLSARDFENFAMRFRAKSDKKLYPATKAVLLLAAKHFDSLMS